jgi:hypothetical protein
MSPAIRRRSICIEFGQSLVGLTGAGQHLGNDEAGFEDLVGQEVTQPQVQEGIVAGPADAVLQEADRLGRPVVVEKCPDIRHQLLGLGIGKPVPAAGVLVALGRGRQRLAKRSRRVAIFTAVR